MRLLLPAILVLTASSTALASSEAVPMHVSPAIPVLWWTLARVLLLAAFLFATVAAVKIPGTGIPETIALLLLAALLTPSFIVGDVQWYELAMIATGLALLGIEIFIIPGFGATGVGGILLLAVGFLLAFLPAISPTHSVSILDLRNALIILVGGGALGIGSFAWMSQHFPQATGSSRLVLRETNAAPMPEHLWPRVGDVGIALTDLKPGGTVELPDHLQTPKRADVVSKRGFIRSGTRVVVTEVIGQVISVRPESESYNPNQKA